MRLVMRWILLSVAAGLLLGAWYTLAPLTVWAIVAAAVMLRLAGHSLAPSERRTLTTTLAIALAVRVAAVAAIVVAGAVQHADPSLGATLTGDEAYVLSRALRMRDIVLGMPVTKFDYFVAFDEYGRNSYLSALTWLQVVFGPTPYGMRLLNAVIFTSAAVLLFREAREAFGWLPAYLGLIVTLFYPTLFVWSISLLKEPLYLFGSSLALVSAIRLLRGPTTSSRLWSVGGIAVGLALIADLRPGAVVLMAAGLAFGVAMRELTRSAARAAVCGAVIVVAAGVLLVTPALQRRAAAALDAPARQHSGHVFTVGHAYKTLDEGFYLKPQAPSTSNITLTPAEAARYVARSAVSFLVVPVPWQLASTRELVYLPEQLLWYAIVVLTPFGVAAGWRRNPSVTALLLGCVLPTALALALTNGNVGTMLRLRGIVIPYLGVLTAVGFCEALERLTARRAQALRPAGCGGIA